MGRDDKPNSAQQLLSAESYCANGQHPDCHAIVEVPGTDLAIFGTDGGLMRSNGSFSDISSQCDSRGLTGTDLATCQQMLSKVPKSSP